LADLDSDGKLDLISGSYNPGNIYWFKAGSSGFEKGQVIPETTPASIERAASAASAVDWDGDGDLDLLVGNISGDIHWLENTGSKSQFRFGGRSAIQAGGNGVRVNRGDGHPVAADWDSDGTLDLLVGGGDGSVVFCKGVKKSAAGPPELQAPVPLTAGGKPIALEMRAKIFVHDWNEDGHLDLLAGNLARDTSPTTRGWVGNVFVMLRQP
jgi:VCBS repeat protein